MKILLIHGLGRTPLAMLGLSQYLQRFGYKTELFGYAAFAESYEQIVVRLRRHLRQLSAQGPYGIVAHSLGGVLTRSALALSERINPKHVVMLGTPNQSPRLAQIAWNLAPFQWFSRECGANLASPAFYAGLPHLKTSYTIIAGTSGPRGPWSPFGDEVNDGVVAVHETRLSASDQVIQLPVVHTFMMSQPTVQAKVLGVFNQSRL